MASLVIRNLDDDVKARLRIRAAENGRSMEAEAREIIAAAVSDPRPRYGFGTYLRSLVVGEGHDLELPPRDSFGRPGQLGPAFDE